MISVYADKKDLYLETTGHAEDAPHGQSIVCAAVSTIMQFVECYAGDQCNKYKESGTMYIRLYEELPGAELVINTACKMLWMLADQYPKDVSVYIMGDRDHADPA